MGDVDVEGVRGAGAADTPGRLAAGTEFGGYTIRSLLGRGAMGAVYEAVDGGGSAVALKVLHAHLDRDPVARERLRREVTALQRLRHPAVARVLDAELDGQGAFVVTELVKGRTLEAEIDDGGPLDPIDLFELADQLAAALEAVHLAGVVHRDLKPSNVMVTARGPVLIDFGIAQALGETGQASPTLTTPGFVIGTPGYLAPELIDGGAPTPDSDWWSWAALLAFAATGRSPFGVRPTDLVLRRSREGRADLVGLPARTARALAGALQADPSARWGPTQVARALRRDSQDAVIAARVAGAPVVGDDATQRIAAHPGGGRGGYGPDAHGRDGSGADGAGLDGAGLDGAGIDGPGLDETGAIAAPTMLVGAPTQLVLGASAPAVGRHGVDAHDGLTRAVPVTTGAVPLGEARYQPFEAIAADGPDDLAEEPAPPEAYTRPVRRRRTGTVAAFLAPLVVLAATRPGAAFAALAALVVLCRVAGHGAQALQERRERFGARRASDGVVAAVKLPWHAFCGVVGAIPQMLVSGCLGVLAVVGGYWLFGAGRVMLLPRTDVEARSVGGMNETIVFCGVLAFAMLLAAVTAWFGPAGAIGREGARALARTVAPGWIGAAVVVVACLIAAWILAGPLLDQPPTIHWWPTQGPPQL
ncbi:serine/threonine-protein kinase [Xylanimonas ulmi]|uniref:Serine/threonine protein kinase n=1 Tax=Xylanimonas ulmi TaxID=228973 RepID=A0A4Q7M2I6_9MICO|nr:serine/threonine-protein kinase [Xylanibacterium ulmi]RZS62095.1 serine/threonine protein kinase [Xylanibacterium ulmi]